MRNLMRRGRRLFGAGGWILPVILLVLPACALDPYGTQPPAPKFDPGEAPLTGAIMCDIPSQLMPETGWPCATDDEIKAATADSEAPAWLATGGGGTNQLLDYSKDAMAQCGPGRPRLIPLRAAYPTGTPLCLNCDQFRNGVFTSADAACQAKCEDLFSWEGDDGRGPATCQGFAKASPNWVFTCATGLCDTGGSANNPFNDPRRGLAPVNWMNTDGVDVSLDGSSITFNGAGTHAPDANGYRAGAALLEIIPEWDAVVEFSMSETNVSHVLTLNTTSCLDSKACPDTDPTTADMSVLINFDADGFVYVHTEDGTQLAKSDAPYAAGEIFHLRLGDLHNGESQLSLWRVHPGGAESYIWWDSSNDHTVTYPLRLEASFKDATAGISNVKMIRVLKK